MKRILSIALIAVLITACGGKEEQVENPGTKKDSVPAKTGTPQPKVAADGEYKETYPDGKTKIVGQMKNGQREGQWVAYYSDGTKQSESYYEDGKKNGKTSTFYPNGVIRYIGYYRWDEPQGTWQFYDDKGNLATTKEYK